jgi:hypothetical protein
LKLFMKKPLQGLPMQIVITHSLTNSTRQPNGSWTEMFGEIQSGYMDMFPYAFAYLDRYDDFVFTTPLLYDETYALMLRPNSIWDILTNSLFQPIIYLLIILSISVLCFIEFVNEKRHLLQVDDKVNTSWSQFHSLIPSNVTAWTYQVGVTRKMQIMTGSVALLLLLAYYQCNLLHQLLIPKPVPIVTVADIANYVSNYRSKVMFLFSDSDTENEIMGTRVGEVSSLAAALRQNPPMYEDKNVMSQIIHNNVIYIDNIVSIYYNLRALSPEQCANYVFVRLPLISGLASFLLHKRRADVVEILNARIDERLEAFKRVADDYKPSELCLRCFTNNPPAPSYVPLPLHSLSGSFAFLLLSLFCATMAFVVEVVTSMFQTPNIIEHIDLPDDNINIVVNLSEYSKSDRMFIISKCSSLQKTLDSLKVKSTHV